MKDVLILSASAGAGHISAARALESAFKESYPCVSVRHEDALEYTNLAFRKVYCDAYIEMVNALPELLGFLYDYADHPWKDEKRRLAIDRLNSLPLIRLLEKEQPEHVVCTHFLPAEIISYLICKKRLKSNLSVVVTDMDIHAMWLCRHYSNYFVALEETREHLHRLGFDKSSVHVTGIPVAPQFKVRKDKMEMREKFGLAPDLPTIYMSSGGYGVGRTEEIIEALTAVKTDCQLLAMCGNNQALKERLEVFKTSLPGSCKLKVHPIPYTHQVDEYMSASDLVLGKPGGLTTAEALSKELGFIIINPIPGQEERNSDHLLERGVALKCNNLPALAFKVDSLLNDQVKLDSMQANAKEMARPNAAENIAGILIQTNSNHPVQTNKDKKHLCKSRVLQLLERRLGHDMGRTSLRSVS